MNDKSPSIIKLAVALNKVQSALPKIEKNANNPFFKSKYADLATVMERALPIITENGLAVSQFVSRAGDGQTLLRTWLLHTSGEYIVDEMPLLLVKQDSQSQGSAITYARRYSFMSILGLVAEEDDDGNAATPRPVREPTPRRRAAASKAPEPSENSEETPKPARRKKAASEPEKTAGEPLPDTIATGTAPPPPPPGIDPGTGEVNVDAQRERLSKLISDLDATQAANLRKAWKEARLGKPGDLTDFADFNTAERLIGDQWGGGWGV